MSFIPWGGLHPILDELRQGSGGDEIYEQVTPDFADVGAGYQQRNRH